MTPDEAATRIAELEQEVSSLRSELERSRARARESEELYRSLVERSHDAILVVDLTGRVRFANPATVNMFGYSLDELTEKPQFVFEVAAPEHRETLRARLEVVRATNNALVGPTVGVFQHKSGRLIHAESVTAPIYDADGKLVSLHAITRDVTERKLAEELQRQRSARYELLSNVARRFLNDDPDAATEATLEMVGRVLDAECVRVFMPDPPGSRLRCTHRWPVTDAPEPEGR